MAIVSSIYTFDPADPDGSRWCAERHELDDGRVVHGLYKWTSKIDADDHLARGAAELEINLALRAEEDQATQDAQAKVDAVLDAAIKAGTLTEEEVKRDTGKDITQVSRGK